jgi:hypothetical protein
LYTLSSKAGEGTKAPRKRLYCILYKIYFSLPSIFAISIYCVKQFLAALAESANPARAMPARGKNPIFQEKAGQTGEEPVKLF